MKSGIYVVQTKGVRGIERELVRVRDDGQVEIFNDPTESYWDVEQLLDSYEVICRLDLNSMERKEI